MSANYLEESLREMDSALTALSSLVPPPRVVPFKDSFVYRHTQQMPQQAIIQKLARVPSGLRAATLLSESGYFQEQAALQRMIDEIGEDIIFLSVPLIHEGLQPIHEEYLKAFFEEDCDPDTGVPVDQGRPMVPRRKIRAFVAQSPIGTADPSGHISSARVLSKVYSGFVHAASPQIMDMYGGNPPHFHTSGMLNTPLEADYRRDLTNYYYRGLIAFGIAAKALGHQIQFDRIYALCCKYEKTMGIRK